MIESLNGEPCITFYGYQHDRDAYSLHLRRPNCECGYTVVRKMKTNGMPAELMCFLYIRAAAHTA